MLSWCQWLVEGFGWWFTISGPFLSDDPFQKGFMDLNHLSSPATNNWSNITICKKYMPLIHATATQQYYDYYHYYEWWRCYYHPSQGPLNCYWRGVTIEYWPYSGSIKACRHIMLPDWLVSAISDTYLAQIGFFRPKDISLFFRFLVIELFLNLGQVHPHETWLIRNANDKQVSFNMCILNIYIFSILNIYIYIYIYLYTYISKLPKTNSQSPWKYAFGLKKEAGSFLQPSMGELLQLAPYLYIVLYCWWLWIVVS